jgi:phospholipase/carboxylesterase
MAITTSSSLPPRSGGAPKQLVLLLHGYGSNGADLISLAPHWQLGLPEALFLAPDAPERCAGSGGFQWWALSSIDEQALAAGAARAGPVLDAYIDHQLERLGLTESELAIVGFSQGTMMALHVGLRRQRQVAGIVGYSGMLTGAPALAHASITKPPVLLVHGSADPIVPVIALHHAKATLQRLGLEVTAHVTPGLGHSVDPVGLRLGGEFVQRVLAG